MHIPKKVLFPALSAIVITFAAILFMLLSDRPNEQGSYVYEGWSFPLDINEFLEHFYEGELLRWHVLTRDIEISFERWVAQNFDNVERVFANMVSSGRYWSSSVVVHLYEPLDNADIEELLEFVFDNLIGVDSVVVINGDTFYASYDSR